MPAAQDPTPVTFRILQSQEELQEGFKILRELRPHLNEEQFFDSYRAIREPIQGDYEQERYRLIGAFLPEPDRGLVGLMGCRVLTDFVHGRHLYIDDLVVTEKYRSHGIGAQLLRFAQGISEQLRCSGMRLATGVQNSGGMKFYEREGWALKSVTYKKGFK